jgi:hypothetical protein
MSFIHWLLGLANFVEHMIDVTVSGGRGGLHCLSDDESRRAYKAPHLR